MDRFFSQRVIQWYLQHKRDLPWRNTKDPYKIWVSEIILQQTRIAQGLDYYLRFIDRFPNINSLANASEDEVLLLWQGLGYYSRARNMHHAAREMATQWNGSFPTTYQQIRSLKGIGDYTAAAIASFAFHLPHAVLDGNVFRLLSRYFEISTPIDSTAGKKEFAELAQHLLDPSSPDLHNQGMMDLGATICLPISPKCEDCPLSDSCSSFANKSQNQLPVKAKQIKQRDRYFVYWVVRADGNYFLHKRNGKDIWQGLYEFPLVETPQAIDAESDLSLLTTSLQEFKIDSVGTLHPPIKHVLSHQTIHAFFVEATGQYLPKKESEYITVAPQQLHEYAVSRLTEIFLEKHHL